MSSNIENIIEDNEDNQIEQYFKIRYWNTTYTFSRLAELYKKEKINIPDLQRGFVWTKEMASKLIDSILLGIPLPNFFFYKNDDETNDIIDGLQRVIVISTYINGNSFPGEEGVFKLLNKHTINKNWRNKSFEELSQEQQDRLMDGEASIIFFEQRFPNIHTNDIKKYVFERINTGGVKLTSQEIRNALFPGKLRDEIKKISEIWKKKEQKFTEKDYKKYIIDELILRIIVTYNIVNNKYQILKKIEDNKFKYENGKTAIPLKIQMDYYMEKNKDSSDNKELNLLKNVIEKYYEKPKEKNYLGKNLKSPKINAISAETLFIVYMKCLENKLELKFDNIIMKKYENLQKNKEKMSAFSIRTTNIENYKKRLDIISEVLLNTNYENIGESHNERN